MSRRGKNQPRDRKGRFSYGKGAVSAPMDQPSTPEQKRQVQHLLVAELADAVHDFNPEGYGTSFSWRPVLASAYDQCDSASRELEDLCGDDPDASGLVRRARRTRAATKSVANERVARWIIEEAEGRVVNRVVDQEVYEHPNGAVEGFDRTHLTVEISRGGHSKRFTVTLDGTPAQDSLNETTPPGERILVHPDAASVSLLDQYGAKTFEDHIAGHYADL